MSSPNSPPLLTDQINAATRQVHADLNRLLLERLPLALPPHSYDPSKYISGILHIAPIYITFEKLWLQTLKHDVLTDQNPSEISNLGFPISSDIDVPSILHRPIACSRIDSVLRHVQLPGLFRAARLRTDLGNLMCTPEDKVNEKLIIVSESGSLSAFLDHIQRNINRNPHIILAYTWVLYMALFSGGRYLRASLKEAGGIGADFWRQGPSSDEQNSESSSSTYSVTAEDIASSKTNSRLDFFNFIGDADGEDLKMEFKKRMIEAERLLTKTEKKDIISEAQHIFQFIIEIVWDLDMLMGTVGI